MLRSSYKKYKLSRKPFYKKYPYPGRNLSESDKLGLIDFELGIFYNRIPKAGNSTIVKTLSEIKNGELEFNISAQEIKKSIGKRPSELSIGDVSAFSDTFKFTFVRNPFARVLSAYLDKVVRNRYLNDRRKSIFQKTPFWGKSKPPTFIEFLEYLRDEGAYSDKHWAPQNDLLLLPVTDFDFVGKLENLKSDMRTVFKNIQIKRTPRIANYNLHATQANERIKEYYDKNSENLVVFLYKRDFELFDYKKNIL